MNPLRYGRAVLALVMFSVLEARAQEPLTTRWESAPLTAAFAVFSETGRMPPDLGRFIADAALQKIDLTRHSTMSIASASAGSRPGFSSPRTDTC